MKNPHEMPELYCFKYSAIRRPDQIRESAEQFAWKCRKYQNWKEVQNSPEDKQTLLDFANALLNDGTLRLDSFGRVSAVFYNVQCWRKRKLGLDGIPDVKENWKRADLTVRLAIENAQLAIQRLTQWRASVSGMRRELIWDVFYAKCLCEMFIEEGVPGFPTFDMSSGTAEKDLGSFVRRMVEFLCGATGARLGLANHTDSARELLTDVFQSLGLPAPQFEHVFDDRDFQTDGGTQGIVVMYSVMAPLQLMKVEEVEGNVLLTVNSDHRFVKKACQSPATKSVLEAMLMAYAQAAGEMRSRVETLESLSAYLGLFLLRHDDGLPM